MLQRTAIPSLHGSASRERFGDTDALLLAARDATDQLIADLCAKDAIEAEDGC